MIKVARGAKPTSLKNNGATWLAQLIAALASGNKAAIDIAFSRYGQPDVKSALEVAFNEKCAYCESEINSITYGHIEHFRPKSKYPKQTFNWNNLLLSCPRCNDKQHKGDKFPTANSDGPLVDPCSEDPNNFFDFVYDPVSKLALTKPKNNRAITTGKIFGLNVRKALVRRRSNLIRNLVLIKQHAATDPEALAIITEAKLQKSEFSAWANSLL